MPIIPSVWDIFCDEKQSAGNDAYDEKCEACFRRSHKECSEGDYW